MAARVIKAFRGRAQNAQIVVTYQPGDIITEERMASIAIRAGNAEPVAPGARPAGRRPPANQAAPGPGETKATGEPGDGDDKKDPGAGDPGRDPRAPAPQPAPVRAPGRTR
jgi:hypothetical protein